ncbi:MAG: presqualene diphosphate synthase HpnD [Acidobacteriota bacterium]
MKPAAHNSVSFTPWRLRERTRGFRRDLARTIQSNFFYSFLFLPAQKREAIIDVYSFCRAVDDVVDEMTTDSDGPAEAPVDPISQLQEWRAEIEACYNGRPTRSVTRRLQRTLERFPMPKEYFIELIAGCEMDLYKNRYETFDDLYQYCYRVASITGLMCIEIFTYQHDETRDYAINLGIALQLTNILRDLKEDSDRGRIYLPQEDLRHFGYSERDLESAVVNDQFHSLMEFECDRAREYYHKAATALPTADRPTMVAAITMGRIYFRLLERIEHVDYDVFHKDIRLHRPERFLIAFSEWARSRTASIGLHNS